MISTSATTFAEELTDAVDTQDLDHFRSRYCRTRLFVFEDLDELTGKQAVQEELVCTVDALLATDGQVLVTATMHPAQMPDFMPSLQSRLGAGLIVPLAPPGVATRVTILHQLAALRDMKLSEPAGKLLAEGLRATAPELQEALAQLETAARLNAGTVDVDAAQAYLASRSGSRPPNLGHIAMATAGRFSLTLADLKSPSRRRAVVTARGVAMLLARHLSGKSLQQIGTYFGGRDRTTVMHACRKTESLLKTDPTIRTTVRQLLDKWQDR